MENKEGRNCHQGIEVDATHQESNSLDVNENNRDGFRFSSIKFTIPKDRASEMIDLVEQVASKYNAPILYL
jgi:hypothetical protein